MGRQTRFKLNNHYTTFELNLKRDRLKICDSVIHVLYREELVERRYVHVVFRGKVA